MNKGQKVKADDYRRVFDDYVEGLEFEHELINRKITWLLTSQTILFAALGLTLRTPTLTFVQVIAVVGLVIGIIVGAGLAGNFRAKWLVYSDFKAFNEELPGEPQPRWGVRRGTNRVEWGVRTPVTVWGMIVDLLIPIMFVAAWVFVFSQSDEIVEAARSAVSAETR
jgi:hypothetical protein